MTQKIIFIIVQFLAITQIAFPQKTQTIIQGRISDDNEKTPIPYAHVGILGTGIGTVSNINGKFELKGNFDIKSDTLMISHIEYEKELIPINKISADSMQISLHRNEYILADVVVLPKNKTNEIFSKVIKNLKNNYPEKIYQCEAFYRELHYSERTKKYSKLIEAAVNIQDSKVTSPLVKIKCSLLQLRKSDNYSEEHWGSKLLKKILDYPSNNLQNLLLNNPIRYFSDRLHTTKFNPITQTYKGENLNFILSQIIQKPEGDIYVFQSTQAISCKFYIDISNYAILQYNEELRSNNKIVYQHCYQFKRIKDKYYPAFFKKTDITEYLKNSQGLGITESTLSFVNYSPDRKSFKRLRSKYVLPKDIDLYDQELEYNEEFWSSYNILLDEPIEDKVLLDLERRQSLQTQFKKNSAKQNL